ncbi:hypothetical protein VQ042_15625 [Aurantimonas sp. A2-1-M11]|uniref:hypothetical protein n=1 Tax=Aurantimonas sp. A2-1-M11 TaxID=3113712 RepID=UPI002F92808A
MTRTKRVALAGIALLALGAAPALAQSQDGAASGSESRPAAEAAQGAPTPTEPAATETPETPAAAGGEASDATASGGPAGSTVTDEEASEDAPEQPRNAVGDKFELPRVSEGNQVEMIAGLCGVQMKQMSPAACTCLGEAAMEELSPPQRDYLIASVVAPPVAERMMGDGRVGEPDQKIIFAFLEATSVSCAAETAASGTDGAPSEATPDGEAMPDGEATETTPAN